MQWFDIINPYRYDSLIRIEELGWHFIQEGHERIHQPSSHTLGAHVPRRRTRLQILLCGVRFPRLLPLPYQAPPPPPPPPPSDLQLLEELLDSWPLEELPQLLLSQSRLVGLSEGSSLSQSLRSLIKGLALVAWSLCQEGFLV